MKMTKEESATTMELNKSMINKTLPWEHFENLYKELIGQNSNDSSSGGAHSGLGSGPPGTPNPQQVMRPTPSPTGSSGSRSMSPAVAQNHPTSRPSSNQSSSGIPMPGPPQMGGHPQQSQQPPGSSSASNSPQQQQPPGTGPGQAQPQPNSMPTPPPPQGGAGGYPPPPHMHGAYKMGGPGQSPGGMPVGYPPPPSQQSQQYPPQGSYPPRPQQYPPSGYAPTPPPSAGQASSASGPAGGGPPPSSQYPGRPMPNHSAASPHAQYPPYQNWVPPPSPQSAGGGPPGPGGAGPGSMVGNHVQGKGGPSVGSGGGGGPPPPSPQGGGSQRPLNYLKQHLQHKGGYGAGSPGGPPPPPQGYGNGPGMHPGMPPMSMGPPPHHMGPPPHGPTSMGPPASTPPHSQPNMLGGPPPVGMPGPMDGGAAEHISQDNGISSSGSSTASGPHPVTAVVTTGPDGTPIDEVSQQSTLSNASAASGEDPQCTTPKSRKNDPYSQSHLAPPSTSPGGHPGHPVGGPPGGPGEEYEMNSPPNWTRTTASPVFNSHVAAQDSFRGANKKSDSLCKLYEMDDNPERRGWLDKLRAFMDDRRTPITTCPTISKQPLDLFKLYTSVKERGGFVEVTKSKTWKDIAGYLGIGASSSAAYTLRKHYTKNLLAFECHFDRGDIDPLPIIQQVEAGTKKKTTKAASVPSPAGSSNSQDSFPAPVGTPNAAIDGYPGYPGGYPGAAGPQPDYGAAGGQMQRPPSQSNAQTPHAGSPYPGQPGAYGQYGSSDQYNASGPPGQFPNQGQFPPQNRQMYPPYGPEGEAPPPGSNQYGPYGNRPYNQPPPGGAQTPTPPGAAGGNAAAGPPTGGPTPPGSGYPPGGPTQQDYYRPPEQSPQPRRHPDFVKDSQSYAGYNARPQIYSGWQGGANHQYRGQYPSSPSPQGWSGAPPRTAAPPGGPLGPPNQQSSAAVQWEQQLRYPPQQAPPPPQQQSPYPQQGQQQPPPPPQWAQMGAGGGAAGVGGAQPPQSGAPGQGLRPPIGQQQQRMPNSGGGVGPVVGMPPSQHAVPGSAPGQGMPPGGPGSGVMTKPPFAMPPPQSAGGPMGGGVPGPMGGPGVGPLGVGPPPGVGVPPGAGVGNVVMPPGMMQKPPVMGGPPQQMVGPGPPTQPGQPPQQQQYVGPPGAGGQHLMKKDLSFPADSVEATTPVLYRRKRLTKSDVCPIDPWRLFMALRSGLLTECTWALDVINVLLFDDTTVQYFGLSHLPGLLTLLLEHFQRNLAEMFNEGEDAGEPVVGRHSRSVRSICSYNRKRLYENNDESEQHNADDEDDIDEGIDLGQVRAVPSAEERVLMLSHTPNYTMVSRKGLPVRIQPADGDIFVADGQKDWDYDTNVLYEQTVPIGSNAWTYGHEERNPHDGVIDVFKSEIIDIPFARYIRGKGANGRRFTTTTTTVKLEGGLKKTAAASEATVNDSGLSEDDASKSGTAPLAHQTFNKKRRLFNNNTSSNGSPLKNPPSNGSTDGDGSHAKKSKLQEKSDGETFAQPELVKKEPSGVGSESSASQAASDSDCREVDMEIETSAATNRMPNGKAEGAKTLMVSALGSFDPKRTVRDPSLLLHRRRDSTYEDECYTRDEASLYLVNESQDSLARRCICLSNIFRNLTFVPGNETILAKSSRFLAILGRLLLLNHEHLQRTPKTRNYDREEDTDFSDSCSSLQGEREWWWDYLISIRENMLVAMANIAGHLELARYEEIVARPLIDGLLHWAVCPSAHGQDPFPSCGPHTALSPQRLALEALCKLCVTDANVDLVIATPPHSRLEKLCAVLTRHLCRNEDQVLREFSVNLLHYLAAADSAMARTVALQSPCISYLVAFIEQAEQTALGVANQHGINYLRENPDSMGTSLDMLRRAAGTLLHLAKHPDNRSLFMQQEQRLLGLVMSHILDQQVALVISRVLFQVSRGTGPMPSMEYRLQQRQMNDAGAADRKAKAAQATATPAAIPTSAAAPAPAVEVKVEKSDEAVEKGPAPGGLTNCKSPPPSSQAAADENSNGASHHHHHPMPPAATFNDVSNSSTNSNSCGTAASAASSSHTNFSNSSEAPVKTMTTMTTANAASAAELAASAPAAAAATNSTGAGPEATIGKNSLLPTTALSNNTSASVPNITLNNSNSNSNSNSSNASTSSSITATQSSAPTAVTSATTPPPPPPPQAQPPTAPPPATTTAVA